MDIFLICAVASMATAPLPSNSDDLMSADQTPAIELREPLLALPDSGVSVSGSTSWPGEGQPIFEPEPVFFQPLPQPPTVLEFTPIHGQIFDETTFPLEKPKKHPIKRAAKMVRVSATFIKPIADVILDVVLTSVSWMHR